MFIHSVLCVDIPEFIFMDLVMFVPGFSYCAFSWIQLLQIFLYLNFWPLCVYVYAVVVCWRHFV